MKKPIEYNCTTAKMAEQVGIQLWQAMEVVKWHNWDIKTNYIHKDRLSVSIDEILQVLNKAKVFIVYARYELEDGKAILGNQFPHKEDADVETKRLEKAIQVATELSDQLKG